jgi:flagellar biosynthesis/type III secretory pathway M-ring protein FliF/YscJ
MSVLIAILTLALVAFVVLLVSAPLRRARPQRARETAAEDGGAHELHELESAREAKYRELRDCELDFRTGKLSRSDYEATDSQLRAEALAILDRLELFERDEPDSEGAAGL